MVKSKSVYWLSNADWAAIEPHLPKGRSGARRVDDRRVISGIAHAAVGSSLVGLSSGVRPYTTVHSRFNRWSRQGVWSDIFYAMTYLIPAFNGEILSLNWKEALWGRFVTAGEQPGSSSNTYCKPCRTGFTRS